MDTQTTGLVGNEYNSGNMYGEQATPQQQQQNIVYQVPSAPPQDQVVYGAPPSDAGVSSPVYQPNEQELGEGMGELPSIVTQQASAVQVSKSGVGMAVGCARNPHILTWIFGISFWFMLASMVLCNVLQADEGYCGFFVYNIGIAAGVIAAIALAYWIECCCAGTGQYLRNALQNEGALQFVERLKHEPAVITWHVRCYHWVTRHETRTVRDANGNTRTEHTHRREKVYTWSATDSFRYSTCLDMSGHLIGLEEYTLTKLRLRKTYGFIDVRTREIYMSQRRTFRCMNWRDVHQEFNETYTVNGWQDRVLAENEPGIKPAWMTSTVYWLCNVFFLSACFRHKMSAACGNADFVFVKVINNTVYTAVPQIPMADTAVAGTQKNKKEPEKNTEEEEKVDDVALADADTILVKNALVLSVGVSEYNTKDNLPGVITDVENHRYLWKNVYNYRVIPDKDDFDAPRWFNKKYWTYEDIEEFIQEKREELFDSDDKLLYDALIITLNGHGTKNGILPSDYNANDKDNKFPVNYSLLQIFVDGNWKAVMSTFPRIFIVDACRGSSDDAAIRPDEAPQERGNPGTVHKDALTCMLYGNSPGFKVREHAARGGNFSQCLFAELKETNDASTSPPLSIITSRTSKALKRKSDKEQTCWLEGDPQCNNVVFVRKK